MSAFCILEILLSMHSLFQRSRTLLLLNQMAVLAGVSAGWKQVLKGPTRVTSITDSNDLLRYKGRVLASPNEGDANSVGAHPLR